jgi:hypothetical protein
MLEELLKQQISLNAELNNSVGKKIEMIETRLNSLSRELQDQEITIINGNNIPVSVKRDDVIAKSYQFLRPGGFLDKKIDVLASDYSDKLKACREDHSASHIFTNIGHKTIKWEKVTRAIVYLIAVAYFTFSFFFNKQDRAKQDNETRTLVKSEIQKVLNK